METPRPLLTVKALEIALPSGTPILAPCDVELFAGQVVVLLGPSGGGKTTIARALLFPDELRAQGYRLEWAERALRGEAAIVPQRGALLDHLDVAGNIEVAQSAGGRTRDAGTWLRAVDLDPALGERGRPVSALSGGQAQRVAVARTLAAGRKLVVLDEPSVGLDSGAVRTLAKLLVGQARENEAALLVITHDLALAAGAGDVVLYLDPAARTLAPLIDDWPGPAELLGDDERRARVDALEIALEKRLLATPLARLGKTTRRRIGSLSAFRVLGAALVRAFDPKLFRESAVVMLRALRQSVLVPLPFYVVVGVLLGITIPYVVANISQDLKAATVLRMIGGTYIVSLVPPLSAILFVATSGNAVNAWLGSMRLGGQVTALEGLGVAPSRYLWSPTWLALAASYLLSAAAFFAAMSAGGYLLFRFYDVPEALRVITSDVLDAPPGRVRFLVRAAWLVAIYAVAIASIVVSRGGAPKERNDDVTSAMTSAVMRTTLFVVVMELGSIALLFAATKGAP